MQKPILLYGAIALSFLFIDASKGATHDISVHPDTARDINGFREIQPIFNANINGWTAGKEKDLVKDLNLNGARLFLWTRPQGTPDKPWMKRPVTPGWVQQYGGKPLSAEAALEAWDTWYTQDFDSHFDHYFSEKLIKGNYAQVNQLNLCKEWGLTNNLVFHTQLDGSAARHPDEVNRYYAAYIDAITTHAPWAPIDFIQLTNEPDYPWWSGEFETTKESVDAWVKTYDSLNRFLHETYPKTTLIGPCLAMKSSLNWAGFKAWTAPILAQVEEPMRYYNYHVYGSGAYTHLAWMEMFQAEAERLGRPRPQAIVTEMNNETNWDWWVEQLFMGLDHPDKFNALSYHLLYYIPGQAVEHWGMLTSKNAPEDELVPRNTYWLYWTLHNVRGNMLYETKSLSGIRSIACSPAENRLVVALCNDSGKSESITVRPGISADTKIAGIVQRIAYPTDEAFKHEEIILDAKSRDITITLPPSAVCSLEWTLDTALPSLEKVTSERESFAPITGKFIGEELTTSIAIDTIPAATETSSLRLGLYCDDLLFARGMTVEFNGHSIPIYLNEAPKETQPDNSTCWWFDLPLQNEWVQKENTIKLTRTDAEYKLMFMSLVQSEHPTAKIAEQITLNRFEMREKEIKAFSRPISAIFEGGTAKYKIRLTNPDDTERTYQIAFTIPKGLRIEGDGGINTVTVKARDSILLKQIVHCDATAGVVSTALTALIRSEGMNTKTLETPIISYPRIEANKVAAPPLKADWLQIKPIVSEHKGITTETRLSWDDQWLYAHVDIRGDFKPKVADSLRGFWTMDSVEFFIDPLNKKSRYLNVDTYQVFVCPLQLDGSATGPICGRVLRVQHGDYMEVSDVIIEPKMKATAEIRNDGYAITCSIPWSLLSNIKPTPGMKIGLDITTNHKGKESIHTSILGLDGKPVKRSDKWGVMTLKKEN